MKTNVRLWLLSAAVLLCGCQPVFSQQVEGTVQFFTSLATTKATVEGRALRVRQCKMGVRGRALAELISAYDDVKNPLNARIDAWIFVLRTNPTARVDAAAESKRLSDIARRAEQFAALADRHLRQTSCVTPASWKAWGLGLLPLLPAVPDIVEKIRALLETREDADRKTFAQALEKLKLAAWGDIGLYTLLDEFEVTGVGLLPSDQEQNRKTRFVIVLVNRFAAPDRPDLVALPQYPLPDYLRAAFVAMLAPYFAVAEELSK